MKTEIITEIEQSLLNYLDNAQMEMLHKVLYRCLGSVEINAKNTKSVEICEYTNAELIKKFISAKEIEGCSKRTTKYYESTLLKMNSKMDKGITHMTTDDLRSYLSDYQKVNNCSKASVDNVRRNLSSFFSWLEEENYILKSPMKRIHKIKTDKVIKETYTDETLELLRDNCNCLRDLAIIDILSSTGMRVGELVKLNINDIDFENRECVVFGKGNKERPVYFDARTKIHLKNYLNQANIAYSLLNSIASEYGVSYSNINGVPIVTMESSLGLDFKAVVICGLLPVGLHDNTKKLEQLKNNSPSDDVIDAFNKNINILYMSLARAKDILRIVSADSEETSFYVRLLKEAFYQEE